MKLSISALLSTFALASVSVSASEDRQLNSLLERWSLVDPDISYTDATNTFTFTYGNPAKSLDGDYVTQTGTLYDYNCKADGTGDYEEQVVPTDWFNLGFHPSEAAVELGIYTSKMVQDSRFYQKMDTQFFNEVATAPYSSIFDVDKDLNGGFMSLCFRYSLNGESGEVNFIETLLEIKYDLSAGFSVSGFDVKPKDKVSKNAEKSKYELEAYLCSPTSVMTNVGTRLVPDKFVPASPYNQGSLIQVCVHPKAPAVADGIVISTITGFTWNREDLSISQKAVPLASNENGLSALSYSGPIVTVDSDSGYSYAVIESILFAEFYMSVGTVTGTGEAQLAFEGMSARRMLKGASEDSNGSGLSVEDKRRLQDAGPAAEFGASAEVTTGDDGPGALKTAGGASVSATVLATTAALVSAALMA